MASLTQVTELLQNTLQPGRFSDYCPNGLQVAGRESVQTVVTGVTACQALLDAALAAGADAILVHHGYFWKGENACITGLKKQRLRTLLLEDVSLLAYHLPLDAHPEYGNNAQLAKRLSWPVSGALFPESPGQVGNISDLPVAQSAAELAADLQRVLGRTAVHIAGSERPIRRIGFCTGAAQSFIEQAVAMGCDAYVSGEISEPTVHVAREAGIHYFAAGHHATERYGVQALGELLAKHLGISHVFIDIDNPA